MTNTNREGEPPVIPPVPQEETEPVVRETPPAETPADEREGSGETSPESQSLMAAEEIEENIETGFSKFHISKAELEAVEGYKDLSPGKRMLLLENFRQLALGRVHEEARDTYKEDVKGAGFLGRIWKGISKKYQIAKQEKVSAEEILAGGMGLHKETLEQLVKGAPAGPEALVKESGWLEIQYASGLEGLSPEEAARVGEFNNIASSFSRMPAEWGYDTASSGERRRYGLAKERYEAARTELLGIYGEKLDGPEAEAMLTVNAIDRNVQMNQFLNAHPEAEEQLSRIKDSSAWWRAMGNIATERGIYASGGFLARTAGVSLFGVIAAPVTAGLIGGFIARRRAKETLREETGERRRGEELETAGHIKSLRGELEALKGVPKKDRTKEQKDQMSSYQKQIEDAEAKIKTQENFVYGKTLQTKLEKLIQELETGTFPQDRDPGLERLKPREREDALKSLRARIVYTQSKLDDGLVNFGSREERIGAQYGLVHTLGRAAALAELGAEEGEQGDARKNLEARLESFLELREEGIESRQKKHLNWQMVKGAAWSAGFAAGGYLVRHLWDVSHGAGLRGGKAPDIRQITQAVGAQEGGAPTAPEGLPAAPRVDFGPEAQPVPVAAEAQPVTVERGDTTWDFIEERLESNEKFQSLDDGQKDYVIDTFKDELEKLSSDEVKTQLGISSGDIDELAIGDKVNVDRLMGASDDWAQAFEGAERLTPEEIQHIEEYVHTGNVAEVATPEVAPAGPGAAVQDIVGHEELVTPAEPLPQGGLQTIEVGPPADAAAVEVAAQEAAQGGVPVHEAIAAAPERALSDWEQWKDVAAYNSLVDRIYDIYGPEGANSSEWQQWKDIDAFKVIRLEKSRLGDLDSAPAKLWGHLQRLRSETGLTPKTGGLFSRPESVEDFLVRATKKLVKLQAKG